MSGAKSHAYPFDSGIYFIIIPPGLKASFAKTFRTLQLSLPFTGAERNCIYPFKIACGNGAYALAP
jgi:hypothetical protein